MTRRRRVLALTVVLLSSACTTRQTVLQSSELSGPAVSSGIWIREELFFGRGMPDGAIVSDSAFAQFVEGEVVRRFADGFTLYDATGYYRGQTDAMTVRESTKVLVVLYREGDTVRSRAIVDLIASYKRSFKQESVLRISQHVRAAF